MGNRDSVTGSNRCEITSVEKQNTDATYGFVIKLFAAGAKYIQNLFLGTFFRVPWEQGTPLPLLARPSFLSTPSSGTRTNDANYAKPEKRGEQKQQHESGTTKVAEQLRRKQRATLGRPRSGSHLP